MSPRGIFDSSSKKRYRFVTCSKCKYFLEKKQTPLFAIANFFEVGPQPTEIAELTDLEVAFISDVRSHIHLITYRGGHQGIVGWHSLIKTNSGDKVNLLKGLQKVQHIPDKIYVILYGYFTEEQRTAVQQRP